MLYVICAARVAHFSESVLAARPQAMASDTSAVIDAFKELQCYARGKCFSGSFLTVVLCDHLDLDQNLKIIFGSFPVATIMPCCLYSYVADRFLFYAVENGFATLHDCLDFFQISVNRLRPSEEHLQMLHLKISSQNKFIADLFQERIIRKPIQRQPLINGPVEALYEAIQSNFTDELQRSQIEQFFEREKQTLRFSRLELSIGFWEGFEDSLNAHPAPFPSRPTKERLVEFSICFHTQLKASPDEFQDGPTERLLLAILSTPSQSVFSSAQVSELLLKFLFHPNTVVDPWSLSQFRIVDKAVGSLSLQHLPAPAEHLWVKAAGRDCIQFYYALSINKIILHKDWSPEPAGYFLSSYSADFLKTFDFSRLLQISAGNGVFRQRFLGLLSATFPDLYDLFDAPALDCCSIDGFFGAKHPDCLLLWNGYRQSHPIVAAESFLHFLVGGRRLRFEEPSTIFSILRAVEAEKLEKCPCRMKIFLDCLDSLARRAVSVLYLQRAYRFSRERIVDVTQDQMDTLELLFLSSLVQEMFNLLSRGLHPSVICEKIENTFRKDERLLRIIFIQGIPAKLATILVENVSAFSECVNFLPELARGSFSLPHFEFGILLAERYQSEAFFNLLLSFIQSLSSSLSSGQLPIEDVAVAFGHFSRVIAIFPALLAEVISTVNMFFAKIFPIVSVKHTAYTGQPILRYLEILEGFRALLLSSIPQ